MAKRPKPRTVTVPVKAPLQLLAAVAAGTAGALLIAAGLAIKLAV